MRFQRPHRGTERTWEQVTAAWNKREEDTLSVSSVKQIGEKTILKLRKLLANELDLDPSGHSDEDIN